MTQNYSVTRKTNGVHILAVGDSCRKPTFIKLLPPFSSCSTILLNISSIYVEVYLQPCYALCFNRHDLQNTRGEGRSVALTPLTVVQLITSLSSQILFLCPQCFTLVILFCSSKISFWFSSISSISSLRFSTFYLFQVYS